MSDLLRIDDEYREWIYELRNRYRNCQIKASIKVNNEMLMFYWTVGKDIAEKYTESKWGSKFFSNMSMDLIDLIPNAKGFSPSNLRYMMRFYNEFKDVVIVPQLGEQIQNNEGREIIPQVVEQFQMAENRVFMIPWGHIKLLIDKCHGVPWRY